MPIQDHVAKVPRKRSETRPRILRAARELFDEKGVDRVSVEAIAERAGYTRGAFYSNFASIDALLLALYEEHTADLTMTLRASTLEVSPDRSKSFEEAVAHIVSAMPFDLEWFRIRCGLAARASREPDLALRQIEREEAFREALTPGLLHVVAAYRRELTVDADSFARALIAAHDGALANSFTDAEPRGIRVLLCTAVAFGLTRPAESRSQTL